MDKITMTSLQRDILEFIKECCQQSGPPSYREIQTHFGYQSVNTVQSHVKALMKKGFLEKGPQRHGLNPKGFRPEKFRRIPIYGEIRAGSPTEAIQEEIGALMISQNLSKGTCFAVQVKGDSMVDAGILEGDYVIVDTKKEIKSGDIIVALVNGENTLKRLVKKDGKVLLVPENPKLRPISVKPEDLTIQGKVVALQRWGV